MNNVSLFSLQGYIKIGPRLPSGKPGALWWAGNVPEAQLELTNETKTIKESFTGQRANYGKINTERGGRLTGNFGEWSYKGLALGLHAKDILVASGTVTGEVFPVDLEDGDEVRLDHAYASSLVITDSTAVTPLVVAPANYALTGHNDAVVKLINKAAYVQPLKAAYSYAAARNLEIFAQQPEEVYVLFDGVNTVTREGVLIDMYRASFDPFAQLGLIQEEEGNLAFGADLLLDVLNLDEDGKGGYARIVQKEIV